MSARHEGRNPQHITAEAAAGLVTSGMWLDFGFGVCQPDVFDAALAARAHELEGVKIRSCITLRPRAHHVADPTGELMTPLIFDSCITMPKQARLSWTPLFVSGWVT